MAQRTNYLQIFLQVCPGIRILLGFRAGTNKPRRGWFDVVPPQMIVPLDGSEGKPLYLKLLFRPVKKVDMTKYINQSPAPKYITKCHTTDGETTCTTY